MGGCESNSENITVLIVSELVLKRGSKWKQNLKKMSSSEHLPKKLEYILQEKYHNKLGTPIEFSLNSSLGHLVNLLN